MKFALWNYIGICLYESWMKQIVCEKKNDYILFFKNVSNQHLKVN
jgi:hypothetical protein